MDEISKYSVKKAKATKRENGDNDANDDTSTATAASTISDPEYNDVASSQTISACRILASEIMLLQQTRVGAVIPYYVVPTSKSKKSKSTALAEPRRNAAAAAMVEESFIVVGSFLHKDEKYPNS